MPNPVPSRLARCCNGSVKPLFKWLLAFAIVLILLAVVVAIAVFTLVKPEQYRTAIADAVKGATGRVLTLDGTLGLDLFPCCALELEKASLGNPPGFPAEPLARVQSARLAIRLWPLLSRRVVEIGNVRLDGLEANLIGRKDGSNNWNFAEAVDPSAAETPEPGPLGVSGFSVAGISIRDAILNYRDDADGSSYRVEQLQVTTGEIRGAEPFDLAASLRLTNLIDNSGGTVQLKARTMVALDGDVTTLSFTNLQVDVDTKGLAGLDTLSGTMQAPVLTARLANDTRVTAPELTLDLQLKGVDLPGGTAPVKAQLGDFSYDVDTGTGVLGRLAVQTDVGGIALVLGGAGRFGESSNLSGTLRFPTFSPREVLPKLGQSVPDTADPGVLKMLSGTSAWFLKDKAFGLTKLAVVLDDTKITGSLSQDLLPDGSKAIPHLRFDLNLDQFNADRYLGPDAVPGGTGKATAAEKPAELPNAILRSLNLDGRVRFGRLTVDNLQLADVDLTTSASGGRVHLAPLAAKLYGGSFRGGIRLDATGPRTRVDLDQNFSGVNLGALLTDFADVRNVTGTMTLKLDGTAVGNTDDELLQNLAGNLSFELEDGIYKGMDIWYEIRRARALLRRTAPPARTGAEETPINTLEMAGKLTGGTFKTDRFSAEIPFLRVSGDATVDLPKKTLDSDLEALVFEKPVFADDISLADLENLRIPLTVSGPVKSPKVRVDLSRLLKETAKQALRDKLLDRLGLGKPANAEPPTDDAAPPKQEDPLKNALDRLFKR